MPAAQSRGIKLHEYQAGSLLESYKVAIPIGKVATTPEEAFKVAGEFPNGCVVKSQILGGGRGMGYIKETGFQGGVKLADTPEQAKKLAGEFLGNRLVTKQSGEEGLPVN
jgi:succinyl-CoA synthetase beta subunit